MSPIELALQRVKEEMGTKYICHPSRRVQRLKEPLAESSGTDIRRTFDRVREQPKIETVTR